MIARKFGDLLKLTNLRFIRSGPNVIISIKLENTSCRTTEDLVSYEIRKYQENN